jgi:hypothetical protein
VRIVLVDPPRGVVFALQRGRNELAGAASSLGALLSFDFTLCAEERPGGLVGWTGEFVQGRPGGKFVYVNSGTLAGQEGSGWTRRAKIGLESVGWDLARDVALRPGSRLEVRVAGKARDGGPACASVPLLDGGWRAVWA